MSITWKRAGGRGDPCALRSGAARVALAALLGLLAASARGVESTTAPANEVAAPVSLPLPTTRAVGTIARRITPTDEEKRVLDDIEDRTDRFDETALYAMLAVTARAPSLDALQWEELDRPAYANLLAGPRHYRLRPLQMRVKVYYVSKLQSGAGLNFSPLWSKDHPVWEIDCVQADTPYQKDKPLRLYSVVNPEPYIGLPDEKDVHNRGRYRAGPEVRIAALFYKIYRTQEASGGGLRDYPELMVWQFGRTMPSLVPVGQWDTGRLGQLLPLLLLIIVLGLGFYLTRKRLARLRQEDLAASRRRQQRREAQSSGRDRMEPADARKEPVDGPVDPELAAAAEEFLREQGDDDDQERRG